MTTGQLIDLYHRERLNDQHVMLQQYQACGEMNQMILKAISFHENNSRIFFFTFFPLFFRWEPALWHVMRPSLLSQWMSICGDYQRKVQYIYCESKLFADPVETSVGADRANA